MVTPAGDDEQTLDVSDRPDASPPGTDMAALRADCVEQVMRLTDEEALVLDWLHCAPRSPAALMALGRLLARAPFALDPRSPVALWAAHPAPGTQVDDAWRDRMPPRPGTLWTELSRLEATTPHDCGALCNCGPYQRLTQARQRHGQ